MKAVAYRSQREEIQVEKGAREKGAREKGSREKGDGEKGDREKGSRELVAEFFAFDLSVYCWKWPEFLLTIKSVKTSHTRSGGKLRVKELAAHPEFSLLHTVEGGSAPASCPLTSTHAEIHVVTLHETKARPLFTV